MRWFFLLFVILAVVYVTVSALFAFPLDIVSKALQAMADGLSQTTGISPSGSAWLMFAATVVVIILICLRTMRGPFG